MTDCAARPLLRISLTAQLYPSRTISVVLWLMVSPISAQNSLASTLVHPYRAGIKDPHRHHLRLLGHTIRLGADSAGGMGPMAHKVDELRVRIGVVPERGTALKLDVVRVQTRINDVRPHPLTGAGVVHVVRLVLGLVRDAAQAPRRPTLRHHVQQRPRHDGLDGRDLGMIVKLSSSAKIRPGHIPCRHA